MFVDFNFYSLITRATPDTSRREDVPGKKSCGQETKILFGKNFPNSPKSVNIAIFSQALTTLCKSLQQRHPRSEKSVKIAAILKGATYLVHCTGSYGFKTHVSIRIYAYVYENKLFLTHSKWNGNIKEIQNQHSIVLTGDQPVEL